MRFPHNKFETSDITKFNQMKLMPDSCSGQSKNFILIGKVYALLPVPLNLKAIELVFPVTGGFSENEIRKYEIIIFYLNTRKCLSRYAAVKNLGTDCNNFDSKW